MVNVDGNFRISRFFVKCEMNARVVPTKHALDSALGSWDPIIYLSIRHAAISIIIHLLSLIISDCRLFPAAFIYLLMCLEAV